MNNKLYFHPHDKKKIKRVSGLMRYETKLLDELKTSKNITATVPDSTEEYLPFLRKLYLCISFIQLRKVVTKKKNLFDLSKK